MFVQFSGLGNTGSHSRAGNLKTEELKQEKRTSIAYFEGGLAAPDNDDDDDDDD